MAGTQMVWGIDMGRSALKALKLRASGEKVEIVGHDYVEHAKVLSQPDANRNELIASALEQFLSHNDISKDAVVVGVAGQHTLARFTKLPPVATKRIPDIVRYEADQQIPFDMDEVIWDYQTFQEEGSPDLEVGIFAMKRELIREHLLYFEQAAIEPIAVQTGPLAVYNALQFDGLLSPETTILLDIGAENTDLIIATKESFWTRTVPIGGNKFTEALVKSFKLSFAKAENLKRSVATSKYARQIFQAMRPVLADLVQELQRSMGFYASTHRSAKIEKVICVGNGAKLPELKKYLKQNLGLPVERLDSFKKVTPSGGTWEGTIKEQLPSFAMAYGLAVQGLDMAKITSNLLPTEIAKQVVWKKKRPAFAAAAACLFLAGGLIWFRQSTDLNTLAQGAENAPPAVKDVDDAWDVVSNGPMPTLAPFAQARMVYQAGTVLKKKLTSLSGQGETERGQTETLIELQRHKAIIPAILEAIHRSVPVPDGPLGKATTPQQVLQAIEQGASPRNERKEVFIERLEMHFRPDLNEYTWASMVPAPDPINDPEVVLPGMKVEITCRTPNKEGPAFINQSFLEALRTNGRKPGKGFYFDQVILFDGGKVKTKGLATSPTTVLPAPSFRAGGRGRGLTVPSRTRGGGSAAEKPVVPTFPAESLDPVTNEPIVNDWRFTIWIEAVLEDYPEPQKEDQG